MTDGKNSHERIEAAVSLLHHADVQAQGHWQIITQSKIFTAKAKGFFIDSESVLILSVPYAERCPVTDDAEHAEDVTWLDIGAGRR